MLHKTINVAAVPRQVIEHKLLTALEDGDCCAVLLTEKDVELLLKALPFVVTEESMEMYESLQRLKQEAFK